MKVAQSELQIWLAGWQSRNSIPVAPPSVGGETAKVISRSSWSELRSTSQSSPVVSPILGLRVSFTLALASPTALLAFDSALPWISSS